MSSVSTNDLRAQEKINQIIKEKGVSKIDVLLDQSDLPVSMQVSHVLTGYRYGLSFKECFKSLFYWHNETLNIYTDLVCASGFTFWTFYSIYRSLKWKIKMGQRPSLTSPVAVFSMACFGFAVCKWCSTIAHTFSCRSERWDRFWYGLDYAGLSFVVATGAPAAIATVKPSYPIPPNVFLFLVFVMARYCLKLLYDTHATSANRSLEASAQRKFLMYGLYILIEESPFIHRIFTRAKRPESKKTFLFWILHITTLLAGGLIYVTHIPERFCPGKFDILFHSHQWWHVVVNISMLFRQIFIMKLLGITARPAGNPKYPKLNLRSRHVLLYGIGTLFVLSRAVKQQYDETILQGASNRLNNNSTKNGEPNNNNPRKTSDKTWP